MRGAGEHECAPDVHGQTDHTDHEHRARRRGRAGCRIGGSLRSTTAIGTDEEQQPVGLRREHLGPLEAVGMALGRRPLRERERTQRQPEREHVRGEMNRVGDQRQAAEQEPADELDNEKRRVGGQREEQ